MPYPSLRNRVVIITGAGRGFGRSMALALARAGALVIGTAGRHVPELRETAHLAADGPGSFDAVLADVSNPEDCERTFTATCAKFDHVDVLINNAARRPLEAFGDAGSTREKFWEVAPETYRYMVDTNLLGSFYMARIVAPHMIQRGFGRIINISTSYPMMVAQGLAAHGATKAALEVSSLVWAKDLEGTGVTVNVLLPDESAETPVVHDDAGGTPAPDLMVAPLLWLCADESNGVTGRRVVARGWDAKRSLREPGATLRIM
jgi:NAD(P)-dependent dehydrogenase (short-subunit alcohol dehydrogenase family)